MKRSFAASVWREGDWYVAQCLEVDIASQGENEEEALLNLKEAFRTSLCYSPASGSDDRGRGWRGLALSRTARSSAVWKLQASVRSSQKGSHVKFIRRGESAVDPAIVPRKAEIPVGTLRSILNQAHIGIADWQQL
ncbi:MAG: type II toxin-antitoxin system HicA family toxin [Bryobacteraceae bacterium]|nr:type II toxin-antitoxin system HicA family toxin [Bryobacteraceae bacterium]